MQYTTSNELPKKTKAYISILPKLMFFRFPFLRFIQNLNIVKLNVY